VTREVVVTGIGLVSPFGAGVEAAAQGLAGVQDRAGPVRGIDAAGLKGTLCCQVPEVALAGPGGSRRPWFDRTTLLLLTALDEALVRAFGSEPPPDEPALVLGTTLGGMESGMAYHREALAGRRGRARHLLDYLALSQPLSLLLQRGGWSRPWVVSNACASGTSALGLGYRLVRLGREDRVLVAGVDPMSAFTFWGFNALRLVSTERCRPFDARRSGLLLGEGAAAFVLEDKEGARSRGAPILGQILGYGETNDAHHPTHPHPAGEGARRAMERALGEAGLEPGDLTYVNAHGTGTRANDAAEARALADLLGGAAARVPVSSTKGHVGHCLGAAGALEAAFTWVCLGRGFLPPTANLEVQDPEIGLNLIRGGPVEARGGPALSNSFGFGGMNASIVLGRGEVAP